MATSTTVADREEQEGQHAASTATDAVAGAPRPPTRAPLRLKVSTTALAPAVLGVIAVVFASAVPALSGVAFLLLVTVGVGLGPARLLRITTTGSRARSEAAALLISFPVGIAISSLAAQPLLWTGSFSATPYALLLAATGFFAAQFERPMTYVRREPAGDSSIDPFVGAVAVSAIVVAFVAARSLSADEPDGLGVLRVLPLAYWFAVAQIAVFTYALLRSNRSATWWMIPASWLLILHGAIHGAHDHPRFPTAWLHAGFADYLARNGGGGTTFDARFAWPGLFAALANPFDLMTAGMTEAVLRWWPLLVMACMTFLVWRLAEIAFPAMEQIPPVASTVFVLLSWTGQDYFSPQSVGIMLQLIVLILVEESGVLDAGRLRRWPFRISMSPPQSPTRRRLSKRTRRTLARNQTDSVAGPFLALIFALAMIVVHPLSPIFLGVVLFVLTLFGRRLAPLLLATTIVVFTSWFVLTAAPWWSTQIDGMIEQISDPLGNLNSNASERVTQATDERLVVAATRTRVALAAFATIGLFAVLSAFRPRLRSTMPLAPLAVGALLVIGLQSYGGEMAIRAFLFAVPFVAIMAGRLICALPMRRALRDLLVSVAVVLMTVPFSVARFGNETFEMTTSADRDAVLQLYEFIEEDVESTALVSGAFVVSWGDEFAGDVPIVIIDVVDPATFDLDAENGARVNGDTRILALFSESDRRFRVQTESLAEDWNADFVDALTESGWTIRYAEGTRFIVEKRLP